MAAQGSFSGLRSEALYDRIMAERHHRMVDSAAHRVPVSPIEGTGGRRKPGIHPRPLRLAGRKPR